jgi:hypothetical protein
MEIGLPSVPVNEVTEPTLVQNIVTMFQIHKLREDWELMPTALKLEVLMKELKETNDKKLALLTGLDQAVVIRCKKLLSYPKKEQNKMLDSDPAQRIKADFYIELHPVLNDRLVSKMDWFSRNKFTSRMLAKYQAKNSGIKSVTDFRLMKQHISAARKAGKIKTISNRLKEFTEDDNLKLDHLEIKSAQVHGTVSHLLKSIEQIKATLQNMDVMDYYGEEQLWKELGSLIKLIQTKILEAGRRVK